jgi:F-type H+-transporting ATPase subunit delta
VKDVGIAARYAHALFLVTERRGETAQALEDMKSMGVMLAPGTRVAALLATPLVLVSDKRKVLLQVMEGKSLRTVTLFVDLLLRKKRLGEFETILKEFEGRVERKQGIRRAEVVSAVPLTPQELDRIHTELERTTGGKIVLTSSVDASLIGGALVRLGDRVIDRTVKTLLEAIQQQLSEVSV